jgi:hypothetical protein
LGPHGLQNQDAQNGWFLGVCQPLVFDFVAK